MKTSSKIGKTLVAAAMALSLEAFADECKKNASSPLAPLELKTKANLICIVPGNGEAVIYVYSEDERTVPISKNTKLLDEPDLVDDIVRLEPSGDGFKIYLEYPNNIYLVGFDVNAQNVAESQMLIKLSGNSPDTPPSKCALY
ncbi:hypothetical protein T3H00_11255 [Pseudomonas fluorescens]|uniref:hypothetical protein n=1 Tax=Pseudomonas fluorescens TaxID=294 RepID=UPI002ACABF19|nr:hypothetical protein [Pseudomonas fluorescens]MDZ5433235.1 hypothetical protein [Pseudomonas fluorescens]